MLFVLFLTFSGCFFFKFAHLVDVVGYNLMTLCLVELNSIIFYRCRVFAVWHYMLLDCWICVIFLVLFVYTTCLLVKCMLHVDYFSPFVMYLEIEICIHHSCPVRGCLDLQNHTLLSQLSTKKC